MLPLEIVLSNIIPRIFRDKKEIHIGRGIYGYLDTCRTWQQRIAMANSLTFRIGPSPGYAPIRFSARDYGYLLDMAPYIKSFTVCGPQDGMADQLTRCMTFTALKTLHMDGKKQDGYASEYILIYTFAGVYSKPFNQFLTLLHALGASLTQLTVRYKYQYTRVTSYRLCDYLDRCQNLMALSIRRGHFESTPVSCQYPKLQKLDLIDCNLKMDDMHAILRSVPQLQLLSIMPTPDSSIFQTIQQSCPLLQQLFFPTHSSLCLPDISDIQGHQGLHAVTVKKPGTSHEFKGNDLIKYIVQHCDSIESIDIGPRIHFSTPCTVLEHATALGVTFKRLRQISYLSLGDDCYIPLIVRLVQHVPQLESVQTVYGRWQAAVFHELMIPSHRHFSRIGLTASEAFQESEKQFIQHHLNLDQQSNLTEIRIEFEKHSLSDSWALLIPQLEQLRQLEVCCILPRVMNRVVLPFIPKIASGCPGLERFTLTAPSLPIDYSIISILSTHTNFKTIA